MNILENEVHSAIYCSENEYFARRCRHYKAKESKAEWLGCYRGWMVFRADICILYLFSFFLRIAPKQTQGMDCFCIKPYLQLRMHGVF